MIKAKSKHSARGAPLADRHSCNGTYLVPEERVPEERKILKAVNGPTLYELLAPALRVMHRLSDEMRSVVISHLEIIENESLDPFERQSACDFLCEMLYGKEENPPLGLDFGGVVTDSEQHAIDEAESELDGFYDRLESVMSAKCVTQAQLAEAMGVTQPAVSLMISRKASPRPEKLQAIVDTLGVDIETLWPGYMP